MWKLKVSEGGGPWLWSTNSYAGRQVWEFDPSLGTAEEHAEVEKVRQEFVRKTGTASSKGIQPISSCACSSLKKTLLSLTFQLSS
ncbi:unnamed protein product [Urochloa humidicola]